MPFNISSFKTNIQDYGYVQTNKYEVYVRPPNVLLNSSILNFNTEASVSNIIKLLKFRTEEVYLPGIGIQSADVSRYGIGPTQKFPFNAQFNEIRLTLVSDGYSQIWQFWHHWLRNVFQFNGTDGNVAGNRIATYTADYKDNYSTIIQIIIYDNLGNPVQKVNLYEAFPTVMKEIPITWKENNELIKFNISLAYKEFTLEGSVLQPVTPLPQGPEIETTNLPGVPYTPISRSSAQTDTNKTAP